MLSFFFIDTNRAFLYLSSRMADERMKRAGKERTKGVRVRGVLTCAGEFLPFLCSFLCRRVIAYLLSSSSKKKSTTTLHGGKSIFGERIPAFHFLKRDLSTVA